jgi:hypothetical protein
VVKRHSKPINLHSQMPLHDHTPHRRISSILRKLTKGRPPATITTPCLTGFLPTLLPTGLILILLVTLIRLGSRISTRALQPTTCRMLPIRIDTRTTTRVITSPLSHSSPLAGQFRSSPSSKGSNLANGLSNSHSNRDNNGHHP